MITNSDQISATFEPSPATGAEAGWAGVQLSDSQAAVRGKRILVVEDQELLRESLRMMLEFDGHQVTEAGNGAEALNLFTLGGFDLVITDLQMPVMQGNELAASLKMLVPSLPILMITASDSARADAGNPVDALLNKPLKVADLRSALGRLLSAPPAPLRNEWVPVNAGLVCP